MLLTSVKSYYEVFRRSCVSVAGIVSISLVGKTLLRQESDRFPWLFIFYVDIVVKEVCSRTQERRTEFDM